MVYISLFSTILLGTAQILSPVGLGEAVLSGHLINATFAYASDPSVFKEATFERDAYALSRSCYLGSRPCPGVSPNAYRDAGEILGRVFATVVPNNITECFGSGTSHSDNLCSGSLDIQFRQFVAETSFTKDGLPYRNVTGYYNYIGHLVLESGYHVREGVIIDAINGGLGFRNHTAPASPQATDGATWEEDLLWMEPLTTCLGTNWTFYSRPQLAPFTISHQHYVQDQSWFEYEDHATKYYQQAPFSAHGTYHFDQRLSDAVAVFDEKIREVYNVSGPQTRINTTRDETAPVVDIVSLLEWGSDSMSGYFFLEPDDDKYLFATDIEGQLAQRMAPPPPLRPQRRQAFEEDQEMCLLDCMEQVKPQVETCSLGCNVTIAPDNETIEILQYASKLPPLVQAHRVGTHQ